MQEILKDKAIRSEIAKQEQALIDYFGKLRELPRAVQILRASVRPVVTYIFTIAILVLVIKGKIEWSYVVAIYGPIVGFWFGERAMLKSQGNKK